MNDNEREPGERFETWYQRVMWSVVIAAAVLLLVIVLAGAKAHGGAGLGFAFIAIVFLCISSIFRSKK